jgi:hypothetical protein
MLNRCIRPSRCTAIGALFFAHHHRVRANKVFDVGFAEAGVAHPRAAVRPSVVETCWHLDEHVQTHQEAEGVLAALVVDQSFVDYQRPTFWQRFVGLLEEQPLLFETEIVQDVAHHEDVRRGQWVLEEVARIEAQPVAKTVRVDVFLEDRTDGWQIKPSARKMVVGQRYLDR